MAKETVRSRWTGEGTEPAATVVIPTFNRAAQLMETLAHLEAQVRGDFEVIVVDDGSTDDTLNRLAIYATHTPLALRALTQPNAGPARARNAGVAAARGQVTILIGDDTYPDRDFVAAHLGFHGMEPAQEAAAVGWTRWCERERVTPFMRWLELDGMQFSYRELLAGARPSWRHFYTSNLSLKTDYLRRHRFDERFRTAAWEDLELGLRLEERHGLHMSFLPEAVTRHDHPMSVAAACRRMVGVGKAAAIMAELWPDRFTVAEAPGVRAAARRALALPGLRQLLVAAAGLASATGSPNRLVTLALAVHHELGLREALNSRSPSVKLGAYTSASAPACL